MNEQQTKPTVTKIEESLFNREVTRLTKAINPHIDGIWKAFSDHLMNYAEAEKFAAEITKTIQAGLIEGGYHGQGQISVFNVTQGLKGSYQEKMTAKLVEAFLARVEEIGEIAEGAVQQ